MSSGLEMLSAMDEARRQERDRSRHLRRALEEVLDVDHNEACMFCGFKDKVARAALRVSESLAIREAPEQHNSENLLKLAEMWVEEREGIEDCTCSWNGGGSCWYHLSAHEKAEERARSLVKLLKTVLASQGVAGAEQSRTK